MADIQQAVITKILNRNKNQGARQGKKPYTRPESNALRTYTPSDPDAGVWKHDLHQTDRPSLIARLSQSHGRELLPDGKPVGSRGNFAPVAGPSGSRGVELLPSGTGRRTIPDPTARLIVNAQSQPRQPKPRLSKGAMSIMGAARIQASVWVRIQGLAAGTTAEDVAAVFAPLPIVSSVQVSEPSAPLATVELEFSARAAAQEAVDKYNGAVADGNTLTVTIIQRPEPQQRNRLIDRITQPAMDVDPPVQPQPQPSTSRLYSDSILNSDPRATVITLAADSPRERPRAQRNARRGTRA